MDMSHMYQHFETRVSVCECVVNIW